MLSLSVPILPISSIRRLAPLSSRTITGSPACAGFVRTGVQARDLQFPFVTIPTTAQRRRRAASSLGFELTPSRTGPASTFSRKPLLGLVNPKASAAFPAKAAGTHLQNESPKSPRMHTYTKKGEGGAGLFRVQSTSFFVILERRCHNGLLPGPEEHLPADLAAKEAAWTELKRISSCCC
jgi:hypothetical protein